MMKKSLLLVALVLSVVVAQADVMIDVTVAAGDDNIEKVAITKIGDTVSDVLTTNVASGTKITILATPKADFVVKDWAKTGDAVLDPAEIKAAEAEVTVSGVEGNTVTLTANSVAGWTVALEVGENGKVTAKSGLEELADLDNEKGAASIRVEKDTDLVLTLVPAEDYVAEVNIGDDVVGITDGKATINVDKKDIKVEVSFKLVSYEIKASVLPVDSGTVAGAGTFDKGHDVTLTATAADGFEFVNWTEAGAEAGAEATLEFKAEADRDLVANFEEVGGCKGCKKDDTSKMLGDLLLIGVTLMGLFTLGAIRKN